MLGARLQSTLKQAPFDDAFKAFLAAFEGRFALPPSSFDPSRLALVIGSLGPGGAERQLSYLASSVAQQKRFDVKVLVSSLAPPGDFFLEPVKSSGADVHVIDGEAPLATDPDNLAVIARLADAFPNVGLQHFGLVTLRIADMLRKVRPGILHTWMDYNNVLAGLAAELVGVPRLVMAGRSVAAHNFTIFQPYMRPGYRALFQRRNVVFLNNSDAGARDYECWLGLPDATVKTVHNGFEIPKIDDIACRRLVRERHGVPLDAPTVGGLQRFSEEKRPSLVVDAAIELARRRPSAYALIFGDGPLLEPERRKVEAAGFADRIKLPGLTRAPYEALSAMDVFVLASRMEGLPNVLVEAQLMGVPVVCTGSGGMRETFQEAVTGLVARAETASAIADALEVIVADSGRQAQMATLAKAFARAHFTLPAMVEATLALYDGHGPVFDV